MTLMAWKAALSVAAYTAITLTGTLGHAAAALTDSSQTETVLGIGSWEYYGAPGTGEEGPFMDQLIYPAMPELYGFGAPVPDPAMLAIFGIGLLAVGLMRMKNTS